VKLKIFLSSVLIFVGAISALFAQTRATALKLPKKLVNFEQRISTIEKLSDGEKLDQPWVVYSDRGDDFGEKYYVTEENATSLHIFKASECSPGTRKLIDPVDKDWRDKEELFVHFGAEFTSGSMIHKKCVILNSPEVVDKIDSGELSESDVPLYNSPDSKTSVKNVPLYYIYFVYKTDIDNGRFLVGKNFKCDVNAFNDQILGWVDKNRVHEYNTRICFEPNYDESAVTFRRCNPLYGAKVFERSDHALSFMRGDTSYAKRYFWSEPDYYFIRNPEYKENSGTKIPIDFQGDVLPDTLLPKLCSYDLAKVKQSKILTGKPLPGYKFRFPYIDMDRNSDDIFLIGVAGRRVNQALTDKTKCEELNRNKRKINIFFILDNSVDQNKLLYALGQIEQGYEKFSDKKYGVCFYPRTTMGKYKTALGETDSKSNGSNYDYMRNFIINYKPDKSIIQGDNYLKTLKNVLENQDFVSNKTNIIFIINNGKVSNTEFDKLKGEVQTKLVEKNCFIIAYDYSADDGFKNQIEEIMVNANNVFSEKFGINPIPKASFKQDVGIETINSCLLAVMARKKENLSGALQMDRVLGSAYEKIISTVDNFINLQCGGEQSNTGNKVNREDPFVRGQLSIMNKNSKVQYIRLLEKGYSPRKYNLPGSEGKFDIWRTDILFTKEELQYIASALDKLTINQNNSDFSKALYDLYVSLFNRFVGDEIAQDQLRERTPSQIMSDIIGGTFGYDVSEPIKRYTLGRILSNDQQMQTMYDNYKTTLIQSKAKIQNILTKNELVFCLDCDDQGGEKKSADKRIEYYWVPIDALP